MSELPLTSGPLTETGWVARGDRVVPEFAHSASGADPGPNQRMPSPYGAELTATGVYVPLTVMLERTKPPLPSDWYSASGPDPGEYATRSSQPSLLIVIGRSCGEPEMEMAWAVWPVLEKAQ